MAGESISGHSDVELLEIHARTLHTYDAAGRLLAINDGGRKPAARFFLGWTARDSIWRVRGDLPADLVARLGELIAAEPPGGELDRPPACLAAVRAALAAHAPVAGTDEGGPAYCFPEDIAEPAGVVAVTPANAEVLRRWLPEWLPDAATGLPIRAVLVDGAAVAICACARLPSEATEAGAETHPAFRGRGYAVAAAAAWARAVRERGIIPLYSTGFSNIASQRVAAKLGLRRYGASVSVG
jgi:GNAT superfamily N-acetyltransferase